MILDALENAHRYLSLNKGFAKAVEFLIRPDLKDLPVGKHEIDGEHIHALVSRGPGRKRGEALLEAHDRYIDIQVVLVGTDDMGWKPRSSCRRPTGEYDRDRDVRFFADEPDSWLSTRSGAFTIFFQEDAHMPQISSGWLHKVVVKVAEV